MRKTSSSAKENMLPVEELQRFFELQGRQALEMTRKTVINEAAKLKAKKVREALKYFIMDYWHDLARPTLLSVCCESVGGNPADTIPFAVSFSVLSGGIDVHDDIIDESKRKHGRATVYGKYGKNIALLVGDALLFKGFVLLHKACQKIAEEKAEKIMETVKNLFYELGDAEALELELRGRCDVTPKEYLRIIEKKAADVEAHARVGAVLGDATAEEQEKLARYGRLLGMVILINDEVMDTLNKREIRHRIRKEHLPLPLVYALEKKHSKIPLSRILQELRKETPKGIEQTNNLLKTLAEKASFQVKDLKSSQKLEMILRAFSQPIER